MVAYKSSEQQLVAIRTRTGGSYSLDEDLIVAIMTAAWNQLTVEERQLLDNEGPQAPNRLEK